ncbi:MAG: aminotransferase class III-fold pyridoxal phosphate-dependent enzyme, partial [Candidatus Saliniplasma sp.]
VAAAKRAIEVIEEENFVENSREMGRYFRKGLKEINSSLVKEVRGLGLFIGVELKEKARPYAEQLKEKGILVKDTKETVLRFAPPLVITKDEVDWALERIREVL